VAPLGGGAAAPAESRRTQTACEIFEREMAALGCGELLK